MSDLDWNKVGYLTASDYRLDVGLALLDSDSPETPTKLSEAVGYEPSHVSRSLSQLTERGMVEVLNPDARKARLYRLTEDGVQIVKQARKVSQ